MRLCFKKLGFEVRFNVTRNYLTLIRSSVRSPIPSPSKAATSFQLATTCVSSVYVFVDMCAMLTHSRLVHEQTKVALTICFATNCLAPSALL
jgi:hypothetical protein